jgi:tRNA pseudouridine65 synthase
MQILYHDETLVAVNKPSGLLVHRSWVDREASDFALQRVRALTGRRVYPVHRLDRPTSGVLLFAFSPVAAGAVQRQIEDGTVEKRYLAVVRGWTEPAGRIDHPLKDDAKLRHGRIALRSALTDYERLGTAELPVAIETYPSARFSLVRLMPRTGRTRQLRRHMAHIAHPIIGDTSHGRGAYNRWFREHLDCDRLLLHALSLSLRHPADGAPLTITAPVDDSAMLRAISHLGLSGCLLSCSANQSVGPLADRRM